MEEQNKHVQNYLDISGLWADKWLMQLVVKKCEVIRPGTKSNQRLQPESEHSAEYRLEHGRKARMVLG